MGNGCSCMTNAPKEHQQPCNIIFPSNQESSNDFISSLMDSTSRPMLSNTQSLKHVNFTRSLKDRNYLIQILKATNIPLSDNHSHSNIYITLNIVDSDTNAPKGSTITSLHRIHTTPNPIWNCYRSFQASEFHDKLMFQIWRKSIDLQSEDQLMGSGEANICEGFVNVDDQHTSVNLTGQLSVHHDSDTDEDEEDEDCLQEVIIHSDNATKQAKTQETKLYFKLFAMQLRSTAVEQKTIFFIQNTHKQIGDDPSLSVKAMDNAIRFNQKWKLHRNKDTADINDFLSSQVIYSSPFSTATQTAILSLLNHPCLERKGIHYVSNLRDVMLKKDDDEEQHSHAQSVEDAINHITKHKQNVQINTIHVELNDCSQSQQWWKCGVDTKPYFEQRLTDFMYYVRYSGTGPVICVVHPLWFKGFLKRYVKTEEMDRYASKELVKEMIKGKVFEEDTRNGSIGDQKCIETDEVKDLKTECFRVNVSFSDQFERGLIIEDVRLLFDEDTRNDKKDQNKEQKEKPQDSVN
eukprot:121926_1